MNDLTLKSTVGELYKTPVGKDVLDKLFLQLGVKKGIVKNPLVSNLKLDTVRKLAKNKLDDDFFEAILKLVNSEKDVLEKYDKPVTKEWWKEAVFYQIYPRSFYDANKDGVGDLKGITSKLDYLKDLGVDAIWLSPIYDSPNDDNGYDIRDYRKIMTDFGTMEDFDELLQKTHEKGMRLIMDLVVNHSSDEHEWFQKALADENSPERDYYWFVKDEEGKNPPNNWLSFFSGSAWNYYPEAKAWALHIFSKKQMDLNWDNPDLRKKVSDMVSWWLDKGVDGFRMDVINYISKEALPDGTLPRGNDVIGGLIGFTGVEHYFYGPNLHKYLHELSENAFAPHKAFSVGETPGLGMNMCRLMTDERRGELNMVFSFDQLETPGHVRFDDYKYDLNYYRDYISDWMTNYGDGCWMSLFYDNHDNPRMASKVTDNPDMHEAVQTLLAAMQMTLRGTPFIFQGDEMGLVNYDFKSMDEITDVESINLYDELIQKGKTADEAFKIILAGTREHARILLPWNDKIPPEDRMQSDKTPTFLPQDIRENITEVYKKLIALRKENPTLIYAPFELLCGSKNRFIYKRADENASFTIECNLSDAPLRAKISSPDLIFRTPKYESDSSMKMLNAYEVRIYRL